jgi:drug/metabolite transporter (DMT)-like permease
VIGEAAALCAAMSWAGGSHLFERLSRRDPVSPWALNTGKCLAAAVLFALTRLVLVGPTLPAVGARPLAWLAASGVAGLALGDAAYFGALLALGTRRALLLLSTAPVFATVGGALWLDEAVRPRDGAAILAVLAGVALVVHERTPAPAGEAVARVPVRGVLLGLGAGLGQAAGSLMSRKVVASGINALDTSLVRLTFGLLGLLVVGVASRSVVPWARELARPRLAASIAASAALGSYLGIWLSQLAIARAASIGVASTLLATSPIFALPLGRWLNAEKITVRATLGTLVACLGLMLLTFGQEDPGGRH